MLDLTKVNFEAVRSCEAGQHPKPTRRQRSVASRPHFSGVEISNTLHFFSPLVVLQKAKTPQNTASITKRTGFTPDRANMKRHSPAERAQSAPRPPHSKQELPQQHTARLLDPARPHNPTTGLLPPLQPHTRRTKPRQEEERTERPPLKAPATYDMRAPPAAASRSSPARAPPCSGQTPPAGNGAGRAVGGPGGRDGGGGRGGEPPVPQAAGRCSGPGDERGASPRWGSRGGRALPGPAAG